jgi:hypothetical protein
MVDLGSDTGENNMDLFIKIAELGRPIDIYLNDIPTAT